MTLSVHGTSNYTDIQTSYVFRPGIEPGSTARESRTLTTQSVTHYQILIELIKLINCDCHCAQNYWMNNLTANTKWNSFFIWKGKLKWIFWIIYLKTLTLTFCDFFRFSSIKLGVTNYQNIIWSNLITFEENVTYIMHERSCILKEWINLIHWSHSAAIFESKRVSNSEQYVAICINVTRVTSTRKKM